MKTINTDILKTDILGSKKEIFKIEFPKLTAELDTFIQKPTCGGCVHGLFTKLFADTEFDQKIKVIYGDDIEVDKTIPNISQWIPQTIVKDIPLEEWEAWFKENGKISPKNQIRLFSTFFNPIKNVVTVSMSVLKTN